MKFRASLSFMACGFGLLLCGCGGGNAPAPAVNPLAGNWLIVGPMPSNDFNPSGGFRLAMTFDVIGNDVVAGGSGSNFCDGVQSGFGFRSVLPATGTVAADGSFTVATSASDPFETISIKGTAPRASGEQWSGSYAVSLGGHAPACDANLSGTFTATSFPLVNGVYVGTGSTLTGPNGVPAATPIAFQVTLKQGAMVTNPGNGAASNFFSSVALTGSIKVQGSPCFSSGVTESGLSSGVVGNSSGVAGNFVDANFLMDDGSTLNLTGSLTDISEGHIETSLVLVNGGNCGGFNNLIQLPGLDRQS
jgi:hypothetical protein